jgi:hypothetical protein
MTPRWCSGPSAWLGQGPDPLHQASPRLSTHHPWLDCHKQYLLPHPPPPGAPPGSSIGINNSCAAPGSTYNASYASTGRTPSFPFGTADLLQEAAGHSHLLSASSLSSRSLTVNTTTRNPSSSLHHHGLSRMILLIQLVLSPSRQLIILMA